ncbi:VIT1/CCC1 transporter family protein [Agromyces seonyuensis]|uniref:Rubrerythrin family protein n=1 Tax=Agromyces seonyuensis TaxID=2662446 RepID=A0A6I4NZ07_9MICO|nr:VIT1/CCC1 family protein [Agromyces seonyuensis]MWB98442.1 rubrerythrin family protein [Agromyces seonyuensis]
MDTRERRDEAAKRAKWRRYLADERAEGAVYRQLAARREGEEREILLALAAAEQRHEAHWLALLDGDDSGIPKADLRTRILGGLAKGFGSIFVLALAQRAEGRSPYGEDPDATPAMAADERIHGEVVRGLAARGRRRLAGTFRAAVFGANDGLVSNLALVLGIGATGVANSVVLFTGIAGLLAGALSMGAGEYVSVRSSRELLEASSPDPDAEGALPDLDFDANELALVYRARGLDQSEAEERAALALAQVRSVGRAETGVIPVAGDVDDEAVGTGLAAALSSFCFFAGGALIPVLPYLFGMTGIAAVALSVGLVSIALLATGSVVGILSGASPLRRALRQLAIGLGAAAVTYVLGLAFGTSIA